jgi:hypothetical protein
MLLLQVSATSYNVTTSRTSNTARSSPLECVIPPPDPPSPMTEGLAIFVSITASDPKNSAFYMMQSPFSHSEEPYTRITGSDQRRFFNFLDPRGVDLKNRLETLALEPAEETGDAVGSNCAVDLAGYTYTASQGHDPGGSRSVMLWIAFGLSHRSTGHLTTHQVTVLAYISISMCAFTAHRAW